MHDSESGLPSIPLPRTRVNKAALLSALGAMCQNSAHSSCDTFVHTGGGTFSGARERKNKIVLGQSPSPEKAHYGCLF